MLVVSKFSINLKTKIPEAEIENFLSRVAQPNRTSILGYVLNNALNSENPVAFINNQLDEFRRAKDPKRNAG